MTERWTFAIAFLGLAYSLYPYVVIDRLTIWEAAAHPSALKVVFIGAAIVLGRRALVDATAVLLFLVALGIVLPLSAARRDRLTVDDLVR